MSETQPMPHLPWPERFIPSEELKWGQTPFDNLTREELLRLVQAYHSALMDAASSVEHLRYGRENTPYWQPGGRGYPAYAKITILQHLTQYARDGGEAASRAFFRYADDLLFPGLAVDKWVVYPNGDIYCPGRPNGAGGRPLTWDDLKPTDSTT